MTLTYKCSTDYQAHRDNMLNLHKCGYGAALPQLYDSLYVGNPYGRPLLGLCYDKDTLVGQENYIRQNLASAGKLHNGALGINTLVDPKYRLFHGVFHLLGDNMFSEGRNKVFNPSGDDNAVGLQGRKLNRIAQIISPKSGIC